MEYDTKILDGDETMTKETLLVFDALRLRHSNICGLIDNLNDIFSGYTFVNVASNIILLCCLTFRCTSLVQGGSGVVGLVLRMFV